MMDRPVRHADLLLMPSLSEVSPLVVLEAFTAGVPVIGTYATPFCEELEQFHFPVKAYTFIPLPSERNFRVERANLILSDAEAKGLAAKLIQLAAEMSPPRDEDRAALSEASLSAGFDEDVMIKSFQRIYQVTSMKLKS